MGFGNRGGAAPSRGGRGGAAAPRRNPFDEESSDEEVQAPARGAVGSRGGLAVRGRGGAFAPAPRSMQHDDDEDSDEEDDEDYDDEDDEFDEDDEDFDGEMEEEVEDITEDEFKPHKDALLAFKADATTASHEAILTALEFLEEKVKADLAAQYFGQGEGLEVLVALVKHAAEPGAAPAFSKQMLGSLFEMLSAYATRRASVEAFATSSILANVVAFLEKNAADDELAESALQVIDYAVQYNQQNKQIEAALFERVTDPEALEKLASIKVKDVRIDVVKANFIEFAASKVSQLSGDAQKLVLNILYGLIEETESATPEEYNPKQRFLAAGGLVELEGIVLKLAELIKSSKPFDTPLGLLVIRLCSGLSVEDPAMTRTIGECRFMEFVNAFLNHMRETNFDADNELNEEDEQLMCCTLEFVGFMADEISIQRKLLKTDVFDHIINFLEHAALGDTTLVVSEELRDILVNALRNACYVEDNEPKDQRLFADYVIQHESALTVLLDLIEQDLEEPEDEESAELMMDRMSNELPNLIDILCLLGSSRANAEKLVAANLHKKMHKLFDESRKSADKADDPDQVEFELRIAEKAVCVLSVLACVPAVQKFLLDAKCEPIFRRIAGDDETSPGLRSEVFDLLCSLMENEKWSALILQKPKEYLDKATGLLTHFLEMLRASAIHFLAAAVKTPAAAAHLQKKKTLITKVVELAAYVDNHDAKPDYEDEDEEEEDEEEKEADEDEENDADYLAQEAFNFIINLTRASPAAAAEIASQPMFVQAMEKSLSPENELGVLRALACIALGQVALADKENKFTPAPLLSLLDSQIPKVLPAQDDEKALTLDASVEWEVATDILPLLDSTQPVVQRLGSYFLAILSSSAAYKSLLQKPEVKSKVESLTVSVDELTSVFAKLTVEKL